MASGGQFEFNVEPISEEDRHWRNSFDSRFLRVAALNGKPVIVTIVGVEKLISKRAGETKTQLLIQFREFEKKFASNVTCCTQIEALYGANIHEWIGKRIQLFPTETTFGRAVVECIRVRDKVPPEPAAAKAAPAQPTAQKRRPEVNAYTARMKVAATDDDLSLIADAITEDNDLSADETQYLIEMLRKRRGQLVTTPTPAA